MATESKIQSLKNPPFDNYAQLLYYPADNCIFFICDYNPTVWIYKYDITNNEYSKFYEKKMNIKIIIGVFMDNVV